MSFECLANELLVDIFEYLNIKDLFYAFYDLNDRFNQLILNKYHYYKLDFRSISKNDFEIISQKYLRLILNKIFSFHLSDNEETPNLSKTFLSNHFSMSQFINLQSVSLYYIQSFNILNQLMKQCSDLVYLKHLYLFKCYFNYTDNEMETLMNNIWSLSKLTHCVFDQIVSRKMKLTKISVRSFSIQNLTFEKITCDFNDLSHLFKFTPCLEKLSINLIYGFPNQQLQTAIYSLTSLKILYHGCIDSLKNLFENLPNLISLTIETNDIYSNGYEWEMILTNSFPNLKLFQLKMNLNFPDFHNINDQAHKLVKTFRTSFWIDEHQWYVRCDWDPRNIFRNGILYTLPYAFHDCFYFDTICSISTCLLNTDYWLYNHVRILSHENPENDLSKDSILFQARFSNINHLKISFPFKKNFWECLSSLNRLKSITITSLHTDLAYKQLQELMNRARNLYSLKFSFSIDFPLKLFAMKSSSIRRLDFLNKYPSQTRYLTDNEYFILTHSSLIHQCEVLLIPIKNRLNIFDLINAMPNLRSLTCHCEDDDYNLSSSSSTTNDEFIEWLRNQLPSTYSIHRDEKQIYLIRFWIG